MTGLPTLILHPLMQVLSDGEIFQLPLTLLHARWICNNW